MSLIEYTLFCAYMVVATIFFIAGFAYDRGRKEYSFFEVLGAFSVSIFLANSFNICNRNGVLMKHIIIILLSFLLSGCFFADSIAKRALYPFSKMEVQELVPEPDDTYLSYEVDDVTVYHNVTNGKPMIYYHGNGSNYSGLYNAGFFGLFKSMGLTTFTYDYPGQPEVKGKPSEKTLVESAILAFDIAYEEAQEPIIVWGRSLGSAVAAQVVAQRADMVSKLILVSPWTSFAKAASAKSLFKLVSKKFKARNKYETLNVLKGVDVSVLIIHGTKDKVIKISHGRELHESLEDSILFEVEGKGHNDIYSKSAQDMIIEFIGN